MNGWLRAGDPGLTVRRLATEAETTSQTIYTHWGSREALLASVAQGLASEAGTWSGLGSPLAVLTAGLDRPAVWRMLVRGESPERVVELEGDVADQWGVDYHWDLVPVRLVVLGVVGGEAKLAKVDGLITGVLDGRLARSDAIEALSDEVR